MLHIPDAMKMASKYKQAPTPRTQVQGGGQIYIWESAYAAKK
ncbi:hypothetical protein PFLUOLIPICF7_18585 [Pseudomonas simiae]|nr:hypothetical protein PFLUOLIPICF7_18585 [Pseudomonas simiae]